LTAAPNWIAKVYWVPAFTGTTGKKEALANGDGASPSVMTCGNIQTMKHAELIERLKAYDALLRENGATAVFVFGSRARGRERPDSDLDLFIDYDPTLKIPNMFRLMQIEEKISETLGIPVTITTRDALHPLMKKNIERDAIRVA
jgi:predicted nucleotidyltransferase